MGLVLNRGEAARQRLRALLRGPELLVLPGAPDAITAVLIEQAGFEAVYASGAGFANAALGVPDIGLVTASELVAHAERVVNAVTVPVVVDADAGHGSPLNVRRLVTRLLNVGAAGVQIEDQVTNKRCGHFSGHVVVPAGEMTARIRAAVEARGDSDLVIVARTDALEAEGFASAVERLRLYHRAGADVLFLEAPTTGEQVGSIPAMFDAPVMLNLVEGGRTPMVSAAEAERLGYRIVLYANTALRVGMFATRSAMQHLRASGDTRRLTDQMVTWEERQTLVHLAEYEAMENTLWTGGQR